MKCEYVVRMGAGGRFVIPAKLREAMTSARGRSHHRLDLTGGNVELLSGRRGIEMLCLAT